MRNAPSVSYPVGRSFLRTLLHGLVLVLGWVVCGAWAMWAGAGESARWAVALICLSVTGMLVWALLRPALGRVRWDGQDWFWAEASKDATAEELRGRVDVCLDWQRGMLLAFAPMPDDADGQAGTWAVPGTRRWLWVEQRASAPHWNALRRAAWSQAGKKPVRVPA